MAFGETQVLNSNSTSAVPLSTFPKNAGKIDKMANNCQLQCVLQKWQPHCQLFQKMLAKLTKWQITVNSSVNCKNGNPVVNFPKNAGKVDKMANNCQLECMLELFAILPYMKISLQLKNGNHLM